ncbi:unnamed protein product [Trichobilharzia regenti]|nr:unnamed protein product [Trichobilharzia regenti]
MSLQNSHESSNHKRNPIRSIVDSGKSSSSIMCYVTLASNQVYQVEVDHKADCQEVCKLIGTVEEAGYFGIQLAGSKNEMYWLNSRNRLSRQIPGSPPYHLFFRVKHQFYTNVVYHLKNGSWDAGTTLEIQSQLIALMAYVQFGNYNPNTTPCKYACFWPECRHEIPPEAIRMAARFHQDLKDITIAHAKYELLSIVSREFPSYGTYFYDIKDIFDRKLLLGIGPNDIVICNSTGEVIERFPFCRVHTITNSARVVTLNLLEDDGSVKGQNYQLSSTRLAYALYLTPHLWNLSYTGKEYAFDLRFTFLEVYDRARRRMFHCTSNTNAPPSCIPVGFPERTRSLSGSTNSVIHGDNTSTSSLDAIHKTGDSRTRHGSSSRTESVVSVEVRTNLLLLKFNWLLMNYWYIQSIWIKKMNCYLMNSLMVMLLTCTIDERGQKLSEDL